MKKYSYIFPGFSKKTGHFTQVVWKDTTKVGMAIAKSDEKAFICANYGPQVCFVWFLATCQFADKAGELTGFDVAIVIKISVGFPD